MHVSSGRWLYGFLLALTTTLLWGVLPIMLKQVLQVMDPYTVTWYRLLSAGLVLFCWLAAKRRLPSIIALSGRNRGLLVVAILGLAFNYVLYLMALNRLSAGTMQLIIQTAPVMLMLGSMLVFRERFGLGQVLGLLVLLPGFVLFFNQRLAELLSQMSSYTLGILIALASAFSWALYGLAQKQLLTVWSSVTVMMVIYLSCALLIWPLASPAQVFELSSLQAWLPHLERLTARQDSLTVCLLNRFVQGADGLGSLPRGIHAIRQAGLTEQDVLAFAMEAEGFFGCLDIYGMAARTAQRPGIFVPLDAAAPPPENQAFRGAVPRPAPRSAPRPAIEVADTDAPEMFAALRAFWREAEAAGLARHMQVHAEVLPRDNGPAGRNPAILDAPVQDRSSDLPDGVGTRDGELQANRSSVGRGTA